MVPTEITAIFQEKINPKLHEHGGYAKPLEYENGVLLLRMGGACSGCLSQDITVRKVIMTELQACCKDHQVKEIQLSHEVDPELWEMAQKILKGGTLP